MAVAGRWARHLTFATSWPSYPEEPSEKDELAFGDRWVLGGSLSKFVGLSFELPGHLQIAKGAFLTFFVCTSTEAAIWPEIRKENWK